MNLEVNGIRIGSWELDLFVTDDGNLGITVYEHGKTGNDEDVHGKDIFVSKDLKVTSCSAKVCCVRRYARIGNTSKSSSR